MRECKIIQIIPAPADMLLRYRDDGETLQCRPLCLALVQYENGETEVRIMDVDVYGMIGFVDDTCNFDGIDWKKAPASAANTGRGAAEQSLRAVSASNDTKEMEDLQA